MHYINEFNSKLANTSNDEITIWLASPTHKFAWFFLFYIFIFRLQVILIVCLMNCHCRPWLCWKTTIWKMKMRKSKWSRWLNFGIIIVELQHHRYAITTSMLATSPHHYSQHPHYCIIYTLHINKTFATTYRCNKKCWQIWHWFLWTRTNPTKPCTTAPNSLTSILNTPDASTLKARLVVMMMIVPWDDVDGLVLVWEW